CARSGRGANTRKFPIGGPSASSAAAVSASYGGVTGAIRGWVSWFEFRSMTATVAWFASEIEARHMTGGADDAVGHAAARPTGTRVRHRPADHGAARPAGAAVGAARALGAAVRAGTQLPGAAEPVRRGVLQRARRPPDRTTRSGHRGARRRRVPAVRARIGAGRGPP